MEKHQGNKVKNGIFRASVFGIAIVLQVVWITLIFMRILQFAEWISIGLSIVAIIVALSVFARNMNSAFKFPWMIIILAVPFFGIVIYFLTGHSAINKRAIKRQNKIVESYSDMNMSYGNGVYNDYKTKDKGVANLSGYIENVCKFPAFSEGDTKFFGEAKDCFNDIIEEVKKAEHFIFMEYHAVQATGAFTKLRDALIAKAAEGVTVRLIYDDFGSIGFVDYDFAGQMRNNKIDCRIFNPISPVFNILMNNRDHRKITVIDGKVGFVGGFNLADEYFNLVSPYGYWKDTGMKITGPACVNLTTMFLSMWNGIKQTDDDAVVKEFIGMTIKNCPPSISQKSDVLIQPYADTPLDDENTGENVYLNIISDSKDYVWFSTPYLIIDEETQKVLILAAERGVDVRLVIPGIPDKKLVYSATKSYAAGLAQKGVKIYLYKPGFNHAKMCVSDDKVCVCGTVNMDYRSFYFHFENAVLAAGTSSVADLKSDLTQMFEDSEDVTALYASRTKSRHKFYDDLLRLISPLF